MNNTHPVAPPIGNGKSKEMYANDTKYEDLLARMAIGGISYSVGRRTKPQSCRSQ